MFNETMLYVVTSLHFVGQSSDIFGSGNKKMPVCTSDTITETACLELIFHKICLQHEKGAGTGAYRQKAYGTGLITCHWN